MKMSTGHHNKEEIYQEGKEADFGFRLIRRRGPEFTHPPNKFQTANLPLYLH